MGKYTTANRRVRNMAIRLTGKVIFKDNDPFLDEIVRIVSSKNGIPIRELHRQYRHYRNRIQVATKEYAINAVSIPQVALRHQLCAKVLAVAINQQRAC